MRKFTFLLSVFVVMAVVAQAQIPNSDFENWTTVGSYENPTGWATMNAACAGPFYSCTKSTDHFPPFSGSYAARIENNTAFTQMTGGWGLMVTDVMAYPFQPGFPVTGNPDSIFGFYKFIPQNSDTAWIKVLLFSNGAITLDKNILLPAAPSWTSFAVALGAYTTADSGTIMMAAFFPYHSTDGPNGNSVVYYDNLSFDQLASSVAENEHNPSFSLFPNPATDIVSINIGNSKNTGLTLNIYSVIGGLVRSEPLKQDQSQINISELDNGIYFVEIKSNEGSSKQKLIIQR